MRLDDLMQLMTRLRLGEPGVRPRRPAREQLDTVRDAFAAGVAGADFALDCVEADLRTWREWEASGWKGRKAPLAAIPELGITVVMFFWPPGEVSQPHEHTSWTLSTVFHNPLEVTTFEWNVAVKERRLERRNVFTAEVGRVGYVYDPAIHSPRNRSDSWATSIHIYNADDVAVLEKQVGPIEGLESADEDAARARYESRPPAVFEHVRQCTYRVHADALRRYPSARTVDVLESLWRLGDPGTREAAEASIRAVSPHDADARIRRLSARAG
jgi:predicted metal-dependent enzyme (double-stranded beta helix superfamily)